MSNDHPLIIRSAAFTDADGVRISHPFNDKSDMMFFELAEKAGLKRSMLHLVRIAPGKESFAPHVHVVQEEFLYVLDGEGKVLLDDNLYRIGKGDYVAFPAGGPVHHVINDGETDLWCLMGGERSDVEIAYFPEQGKIGVYADGNMRFYDRDSGSDLNIAELIVDENQE